MAQNITLLGASYPSVPAVELPKTGGGTATFTDTSDANATASQILKNKTAYVNGVRLTGTLSVADQNTWYGTCTTGATTQARVVTTTTGDFVLAEGNMVRVKFTNQNNYNGTSTLNVDGTGAKNIARVGTTTSTRYFWSAGEVIDFVYDGTNFVMARTGVASTTYYGLTKLSDSTSSTSTSLSATANAVKKAYDLASEAHDMAMEKMPKAYNPVSGSIMIDDGSGSAVDSYVTLDDMLNLRVMVLCVPEVSTLPRTLSNASITSNHIVVGSWLTNPTAQFDTFMVATYDGYLTVNGTVNTDQTTDIYLYLALKQ